MISSSPSWSLQPRVEDREVKALTSQHMLCCVMREPRKAVCASTHAAGTLLHIARALYIGLNSAWVTAHHGIKCFTAPLLLQLAALSSCRTHVLICSGGFHTLFSSDSRPEIA